MIDHYGLPTDTVGYRKLIRGPQSPASFAAGYTWRKPRGCSMFLFFGCSSGAGGGGGFTRVAGAAGGGGGSGACGHWFQFIMPAVLLPDRLYIDIGAPGQGRNSGGGAGGSGGHLHIYVHQHSSAVATNMLLNLVNSAPAGGGTGTGAAAGTAGAAGTVNATSSHPLLIGTTLTTVAGSVGHAGGSQAGAAGSDATMPATGHRVTPGAGGAGTTSADFAGGGVTNSLNSRLGQVRPIAPAAGSNSGSGGYLVTDPYFWVMPPCGGSSSNSGVGGNGGNGVFGGSGAGGGAGTTGGRGGDGGAGFVYIHGW